MAFLILILTTFCFFNYNKQSSTTQQDNIDQDFPKEHNNSIIVIDAGHGGEDGGAIGANGAYEKDINLTLANKLKSKLDEKNIPCVLTRSTDILLYDKNADYEGKKKRLDLLARKEFAESYENAIFISIHQNSYPKAQYRGFQIYYSPNNAVSNELAILIEKTVKDSILQSNTRASKKADSSIYLLDKLYCPAVLIECGFLSNPEECALLCDENYQNELCDSITDGVVKFISRKS